MQINHSQRKNLLLALIAFNIFISLGHYIHNIIFLPHYHEPAWITPSLIDSVWFIMTPFSVIGYLMYLKGRTKLAYWLIYIYCFLSLLVLGHYIVTPIGMLSATIHLIIFAEAFAAVVLAVSVFWLQKSSVIIESAMSDS